LAKYNPDSDPLAGYDADLAEQLETDAASRTKILADLGGQTRTTVDFATSRNSSAVAAAAGAAVNTSLADIPRATPPKPVASVPVSGLAQDSTGAAIAAGAAVNTALADIPRVTPPKPLASASPGGTTMTGNRAPPMPQAGAQVDQVRMLENRVLGLTKHIVSGSAGMPLQTERPSLRDGLWH
jgi:hypothetical protein